MNLIILNFDELSEYNKGKIYRLLNEYGIDYKEED